jgi:hypothetical protein
MTDELAKGVRRAAAALPRKVEPQSDGDEGEPTRGDSRGMIRQTLYLPPGVWRAIRDVSHTKQMSQQALLRKMISHWLETEAGIGTWEELEKKGDK